MADALASLHVRMPAVVREREILRVAATIPNPEPLEAMDRARREVRWLRSAGQVGGEDKLFPDSDYAASFRLDTVTGACPDDGVEPISL